MCVCLQGELHSAIGGGHIFVQSLYDMYSLRSGAPHVFPSGFLSPGYLYSNVKILPIARGKRGGTSGGFSTAIFNAVGTVSGHQETNSLRLTCVVLVEVSVQRTITSYFIRAAREQSGEDVM